MVGGVDGDPGHLVGCIGERLDRGVGVGAADGVGDRGDGAPEAVDSVQHHDAGFDRAAGSRHDVAKHGARLDRRELSGVADEHEPGLGPHRLHEPRHE